MHDQNIQQRGQKLYVWFHRQDGCVCASSYLLVYNLQGLDNDVGVAHDYHDVGEIKVLATRVKIDEIQDTSIGNPSYNWQSIKTDECSSKGLAHQIKWVIYYPLSILKAEPLGWAILYPRRQGGLQKNVQLRNIGRMKCLNSGTAHSVGARPLFLMMSLMFYSIFAGKRGCSSAFTSSFSRSTWVHRNTR